MNCKQNTGNVNEINKISGIEKQILDNAKSRMLFFMGLMNKVLQDKKYRSSNGRKYLCYEDLVMKHGKFFENEELSLVETNNPFEYFLTQAIQNPSLIYCEGFVIPLTGGIPEPNAWLWDRQTNQIMTTGDWLHFGVAMSPEFISRKFEKSKKAGIFAADFHSNHRILDLGFPPRAIIEYR